MLPFFILTLALTHGANSDAVRWSYCNVARVGQEGGERKVIKLGILNGKARILPHPKYPADAKAAGISGEAKVEVTIDAWSGKVVEAKGISGPQLLLLSAIEAAKRAQFYPAIGEGLPIGVKGILVYQFKLPGKR